MHTRIFATIVFSLTYLVSGLAHAAGLGQLIVHSTLGQPLNGEIEITALGPKEFESLTVRVASVELYKERGIQYNSLARSIRLVPTTRPDGTAFLKVTSSGAFNEPSLDMLVDFAWPGGRLVQKYPLALDPAR